MTVSHFQHEDYMLLGLSVCPSSAELSFQFEETRGKWGLLNSNGWENLSFFFFHRYLLLCSYFRGGHVCLCKTSPLHLSLLRTVRYHCLEASGSLPLYAVCMLLFPAELPDTTLGGHSRFHIFLQDSFIQGLWCSESWFWLVLRLYISGCGHVTT